MRAKKTEIERFKRHIEVRDECWVWTGCLDSHGYGQFKFRGRKQRAHRWVYEAINGELPEGIFVDHLCRNRACVRLAHLEPVTPKENNRRGGMYRKS
jgi:hypothetical protein